VLSQNFKEGFSLIELLVVIAIVGIVAAVAAPSYKHYVAKSKLQKIVPFVDDIFAKQRQYWAIKGNFPSAVELAKMYGTTSSGGNFVARINPYVSTVNIYASSEGGGPCQNRSGNTFTLDMQALGVDPTIATSGSVSCYAFNVSGVIHTTCSYALQESGGAYSTADFFPQWYGCKDTACSNPNTYYQTKDGYGGKLGFTAANCLS
jgi:type IV pilus assembly protein PilE